jgi:hypothetical protein
VFPLPKHSGRQLLPKFRVQKMYPKFRGFELKLRGFESKLRGFKPKLRVFRTETSGFRTETSGFRTETSCFHQKFRVFVFVLPKLRVLIPGFFVTETSEYQIHRKFRLSGNRINFRSFGLKLITVYTS